MIVVYIYTVHSCFVSFCVRRSQPQHYCFYVSLVLQPVRGQSALGWFINNNLIFLCVTDVIIEQISLATEATAQWH